MVLPRIVTNLRSVRNSIREDLSDYFHLRSLKPNSNLTDQEKSCVVALRKDGYCIVKDFWPRDRALKMKDTLEAHLKIGKNHDFESGAYMRFRDMGDDAGVRRIYHVDKLVEELKDFRYDPFISRIAAEYYGFPFHSGSLVYQHNLQTTFQTRYYHVDWFGKQFKPFLYLDDVDIGNGPFTYLRGTHRSHFIRLKKQLLGNKEGSSSSFSEEDVSSVLDQQVQLCGSAGTLILADVRGLHRGSPQIDRSRSILVNYMYRTEGEIFLEK